MFMPPWAWPIAAYAVLLGFVILTALSQLEQLGGEV